MEIIDSHCHLQFSDYDQDRPEVKARSVEAGVSRIINIGTDLADSQKAVNLADKERGMWATVGIHPNSPDELADLIAGSGKLVDLLGKKKVVAVGEIGLDYHHDRTPKVLQEKALRLQIEAGLDTNLPFVFHIREAFSGFWPIIDSYSSTHNVRGVVHSFSASPKVLEEVLSRSLHVGFNGLLTYTREKSWLEAAKSAPIESILLETDAPFLTPVPDRGKRCEPRHTLHTARFLADLRGEELEQLVRSTTKNTLDLFGLDQTEKLDS